MHEQVDVNPSGMKGIYVTDGIKIDVYSENAFDEVAKSFCVYMVDVERLEGANTVDSRTFKGNRKKFELSGARRKQPEVRKKKTSFFYTVNILIIHLIVESLKRQLKDQKRYSQIINQNVT